MTVDLRPSGTPPFWAAGTEILWRYLRIVPGYVGPETTCPVTVVSDTSEGLVAWLAPNTRILRPVMPDGRELRWVPPVDMFRAGRATRLDTWRGSGILRIAPTGVPWSVWCFWDEDWRFEGWYVNLEDPHRRDKSSVVSQDHVLDLWIGPDHSVRWKDEDELEAAVQAGRYSASDAASFRTHAREVVKLVERWQSPFSDGWENWRPDPQLPIARLPPDTVWDYE